MNSSFFEHSNNYYKDKLSELALETIVPNPDLPFAIKKNNTGKNIVVEQDGEFFKIYQIESVKSITQKSLSSYYSLISFNSDKMMIEIKMRRRALYFFLLWLIFLLAFMTIMLYRGNFGGILFLLPLLGALIGMPLAKRRFNKFILQFLNEL